MKRKLAVCLAVLAAAALAFLLLDGREGFDGSCVKHADCYLVEAQWMNGTDRHTLMLQAGDTLDVHLQAEKGTLSLEINAPDGTSIYTGNGTEATDFTVAIPQTGEYTITLQAKQAACSVKVQMKP